VVPLADVVQRDADQRLDDVLGRLEERLVRDEEATLHETLAPEVLAAIEDVCTRPGAVVELTSLHDHVSAGSLTWAEVWAAPRDHAGGVRLVGEVLARASV
jgi:hypothetical protein